MTDHERTTVQRTVDDPVEPVAPAALPPTPPANELAAMRTTIVRERGAYSVSGLTLFERVVTLLFGVLQGLLVLRVILLVLIANHSNDIVAGILGVTDPFVEPFRGMFRLDRIASSGSVLDIAAVVALIGWTLIEALVLAVLRLGDRRTTVDA